MFMLTPSCDAIVNVQNVFIIYNIMLFLILYFFYVSLYVSLFYLRALHDIDGDASFFIWISFIFTTANNEYNAYFFCLLKLNNPTVRKTQNKAK